MESIRTFREAKNHMGDTVQLKNIIAPASDLANANSVLIKTEKDVSPCTCDYCGSFFNQKSDLLTHLNKIHSEYMFQCGICCRMFKNKELSEVHVKLHESSGKYFQDVSGSYNNSSSLGSEPNDICVSCDNDGKDSVVSGVKAVVKYEVVVKPTEQNSLVCRMCGKHFERLCHLMKHIKTHDKIHRDERSELETVMSGSDSEEEACNEGESKMEGETGPRRKEKTKKTYQCEMCGKNFTLKDSYNSHQRIHTGEKPFTCHICGKQFSHTGGLYYHLKHVHAGIKNHSCDICGRCFALKAAMEDHRRIHTGERPYVCHTCGKPFKTKASLYIHSKIHTDSFPHPCTYCERRFRWRQQLLAHVTTHTGEKPHTCDICGKGFGVKNDLTRHKLIHSNEKPFICPICGLCFGQKRYLKNHEKSRHGMQR